MLIGRSSLENVRSSKLLPGEVSEWLMVPLSKSGRRKPRGFESRPLRIRLRKRTAAERPTTEGPRALGRRPEAGGSLSRKEGFGRWARGRRTLLKWRGRLVRLRAQTWKVCERKLRGFESHPLRRSR